MVNIWIIYGYIMVKVTRPGKRLQKTIEHDHRNIVDFPSWKMGGSFHSYVNVYQRGNVNPGFC